MWSASRTSPHEPRERRDTVCLIALALGCHALYPLVLAGNRDEFHGRAALPAHRWPDAAPLFGGRDIEKGGTWLGVSADGALAVITNYRDPSRPRNPRAPSRGDLVTRFLQEPRSAAREFLGHWAHPDGPHEGFNLIAADRTGVWYGSNRGAPPRALGPGVHGLSNHLLATPWPKVRQLTGAMTAALADAPEGRFEEALFVALGDRTQPPGEQLPDTGIGPDWERRLAPAFIVSPDYGTRCSTVIKVARDGTLDFQERTFSPAGRLAGTVHSRLKLPRDMMDGLLAATFTTERAP